MTNANAHFKTAAGEAAYSAAYNAALSLWPVTPEPLDVPTRFGSTHLNACGPRDAAPLLLLHALSFTSTMWFPNVAILSRTFRVYALDTINDVGMSRCFAAPRNPKDMADWLVEVLDGLMIDRTHVAGVSMGGWLAMNLARCAPERVLKAVAISPAAALAPIRVRTFLKMFTTFLHPGESMAKAFFLDGFPIEPRLSKQFDTAMSCGWRMPGWPVFPNVFSDEELTAWKIPTLLLLGEKEFVYEPRSVQRRAAGKMANSEAKIIPGASHLLNIEQAEMINAEMVNFLQ